MEAVQALDHTEFGLTNAALGGPPFPVEQFPVAHPLRIEPPSHLRAGLAAVCLGLHDNSRFASDLWIASDAANSD